MRSNSERKIAKSMKLDGKSYNEIASILNVTRDVARNFCRNLKVNFSRKRGPKQKIGKKNKLRIKRAICSFKDRGVKVNSTKIIKECDLSVSPVTVQRYLKKSKYKYRKAKKQIVLSNSQKSTRIEIITEWITTCHQWEKTVFTDEKRFTCNGPDDWRSYMMEGENIVRQSQPCGGGGLMVWMMALPCGLLSFKLYKTTFNGLKYKSLLQESIVPIIRLNLGEDFFYQEDNSRVHKSKIIKEFMNNNGIRVLKWPAYSPDLNIVEDIWKKISDLVYDGPQYTKIVDLENGIIRAINHINYYERSFVQNLYHGIRSRLCQVLTKKGNLFNKRL